MWGTKKKKPKPVDKSIVVKRGWMSKKGYYTNNWKPRLFSLKNTGELQYYRTAQSPSPSGIISVAGVQRMRISEEYNQKNFVLELYTADNLWALAVDKREEAHQWMFALQLVQEKRIEDFNDLLQVQDAIGTIHEMSSPRPVDNSPSPKISKTITANTLQPITLGNTPLVVPLSNQAEQTTNNDIADIFGLGNPPAIKSVDQATAIPSTNLDLFSIPATVIPNANPGADLLLPTKETSQPSPVANAEELEPTPPMKLEELKAEPKIIEESEPEPQAIEDPVQPQKTEKNTAKILQNESHQAHTRSVSLAASETQNPDNEEGTTGETTPTHHRSPSDSVVVNSAPARFQPISINTNWPSFHIRSMQIQTLQNWVNFKLASVGVQVDDMNSGFSSGEILCMLVEVITNTEIGYNEDPSHVAFMHQNVNFAMAELRKGYPEFPGVAAHEIISGKLSSILEMVWNIIETVEISSVEFREAKGQEALLLWAQYRVQQYEMVLTDFEKNFSDGRVFVALAHSFNPEQIDYYSYTTRRKDMLQKALDLGLSTFSIPPFLTTDHFTGKVDPISIVTYLYQWYSRMGTLD